MKDLRIALFGTPKFAVDAFSELLEAGLSPTVLVTQEDKPRGRNLEITPPEAKVWALENGIEVLQPKNLKDDPSLLILENSEWDLFIVAAYGKIIPKHILDLPTYGTLNIHPSLLPKLRGASPVRTAILTGEQDAVGITIIKLDEEMDHGPIIAQARIVPEEWPEGALLLEELLAHEGGKLMAEAIIPWINGEITPEEQNHAAATFSKKIEKSMGEIDLSSDPKENLRKIKALEGNPGTYFFTERGGKKIRVKIINAMLTDDGELQLLRVVPEGKKEMSYEDFMRGQ